MCLLSFPDFFFSLTNLQVVIHLAMKKSHALFHHSCITQVRQTHTTHISMMTHPRISLPNRASILSSASWKCLTLQEGATWHERWILELWEAKVVHGFERNRLSRYSLSVCSSPLLHSKRLWFTVEFLLTLAQRAERLGSRWTCDLKTEAKKNKHQ